MSLRMKHGETKSKSQLEQAYKKLPDRDNEADDYRIRSDQSIYDVLRDRGLLSEPIFPSLGKFVVPQGQLGLVLNNGRPLFLAPGRHTMWSLFASREGYATGKDIVPITQKLISLGTIQIVTIDQGEIGLSVKNGENIILAPGRYILESPHQFLKTAKANQNYIELGTHRRIIVPVGHVAIANDKGKQIIIDEEATKDGAYVTDSPDFFFDKDTGFQSVQIQSRRIDDLVVNTKDGIPIKVEGLITYEIVDPHIAFLRMMNVHETVMDQAESTLTTTFSHLAMKDIAPSLSAHEGVSLKGKEKHTEEKDFIEKATESFLASFNEKAQSWGVKLSLNIEKMEFVDKTYTETFRLRATKTVAADIESNIVEQTNDVARKKARMEADLKIIGADADAEAIKKSADARLYAATKDSEAAAKLSQVPLAAELAVLKAKGEIVKSMGNNAVFMPHDISLSDYQYRTAQGHTLFGKNGPDRSRREPKAEEGQIFRRTLSSSNF